MNFIRFLFLLGGLIALFLLSGCTTTQEQLSGQPIETKGTPPKWVLTPPTDSPAKIYGLGSGNSLEAAKQNALNDVASKLEVHVSSNAEAHHYLQGDTLSSSFREQIQARVKQTRLSNFQIMETAVINAQTYVLLAVSRTTLIKDTQTELDKHEDATNLVLSGIEHKSKVEQLLAYGEARDKLRAAMPGIALMRAANPGFDSTPYYQKLKQLSEREKALIENTVFRVTGEGNLKELAQRLAFRMVEQHFRVTHQGRADSIVELSGNLAESEIFSTFKVHGQVRIALKDSQGKQLYSTLQPIQGASVSSYAQARDNAFRKFETGLQGRKEIFQLLGLTP